MQRRHCSLRAEIIKRGATQHFQKLCCAITPTDINAWKITIHKLLISTWSVFPEKAIGVTVFPGEEKPYLGIVAFFLGNVSGRDHHGELWLIFPPPGSSPSGGSSPFSSKSSSQAQMKWSPQKKQISLPLAGVALHRPFQPLLPVN